MKQNKRLMPYESPWAGSLLVEMPGIICISGGAGDDIPDNPGGSQELGLFDDIPLTPPDDILF
jgi:hypothetical protein